MISSEFCVRQFHGPINLDYNNFKEPKHRRIRRINYFKAIIGTKFNKLRKLKVKKI